MWIHALRCSASIVLGVWTAALSSAAVADSATPASNPTPTWAYAAKTGIGTSYEAYENGTYRDGGRTGAISKVWFSLAGGVLTETMYGLIHHAQIRQLQFAVRVGDDLVLESEGLQSQTTYLHQDDRSRPLSPAYRVVNRDPRGRFIIEKHFFTDPDRHALFMRVVFHADAEPITPYLILEPHVANTGVNDAAQASLTALSAHEGKTYLSLQSSQPFVKASAGLLGHSDGFTDLRADGSMDWAHPSTGSQRGAVVLTAQLAEMRNAEVVYDFAIGFGNSRATAQNAAKESLTTGYEEVLARYNGEGARLGWEDYIASLKDLPQLAAMATDGGRLAYSSALMLKVQEDKTYAGALIASLSTPWGETVAAEKSTTGYKAVWPRDFYQCAMALAALGDRETPLAAFRYLPTVQVSAKTAGNRGAGGWFLQKAHVDGTPEWIAVQLDQTAMPIMLGWKLWRLQILSASELARFYPTMLKPAADFLVSGGQLSIGWNKETIRPPFTQQERWEEQPGHSPSTTAAVITGLVVAADMAEANGDAQSAQRYRATADEYSAKLESRTFTTEGAFNSGRGDGRYYVRSNRNEDPEDRNIMEERNGRPGVAEDQMVDAGFLELVRYGVRRPNDPHVLASLPELDDESREHLLRVRYTFTFENEPGVFQGWRRYGNDGYGENAATGGNYPPEGPMSPDQRGRVWPFLTGERGHYEIALAVAQGALNDSAVNRIRHHYVRALELFANEGLMLPEQVWDGVGKPSPHAYRMGEGTNSATPLAWAHAEYVKLLRSLQEREVWDSFAPVRQRYGK
jgi:glucoamylase